MSETIKQPEAQAESAQADSVQRLVSCSHYVKSKCPEKCKHSRPHEPIRDIYDDGKGFCHHLHGTCGYRSDQPKCICAANISSSAPAESRSL